MKSHLNSSFKDSFLSVMHDDRTYKSLDQRQDQVILLLNKQKDHLLKS